MRTVKGGKKGHVKPPKKIDQDLGFVPLITPRNLAGRQKNVKTTLQEVINANVGTCIFIFTIPIKAKPP
jgi:hypothetical protein